LSYRTWLLWWQIYLSAEYCKKLRVISSVG
jgi:hypothetical protein